MSSSLLGHRLAIPDEVTIDMASEAVDVLERFFGEHRNSSNVIVSLSANDCDTSFQIPVPALGLLIDILAQIAEGNAGVIPPVHGELTTQQAADMLNVSRPFLIKLLDERKIPHRRVGNRRRVLLADLLDYKRVDDVNRRAVADELTSEAQLLRLGY